MKNKIIQVYQMNPFEEGQGGGVRYLKNLVTGLTKTCDEILFIGIGNRKERKGNISLIPITKKITGYIYFLFLLTMKLPFMDLSKFQVVHVHRLYFAIPFILLKPKLKIICSLHGRTFSVFESNYGNWKLKIVRPFFEIIERFSIKKVDFLVPVSRDVLNNFKSKYNLIDKKPIQIIGSMLNLKGFKIQDSNYLQEKFGKDNRYILFLGRLSYVKNIDFLIELWSKKYQNTENVKLIIAGDGEDKSKLIALSNIICVQNKPIFIGEISPDDIAMLISSANICVVSSRHEASPTVIKESLSCGIPIITNKIGDVDEFIIEGENGYIVKKEIESFYEAIIKLIDNPISKKMVILNSKNVLEKCSTEYISNQYFNIYKKLV